MNKDFFEKEIQNIINFAKNKMTNEQGILCKDRELTEVIMDDLGDFLPFFAYFKEKDFCLKHLNYIDKNFDNLNFDRLFAYSDFLFGLVWYARLDKKESQRALFLAEKFFDKLKKTFLSKNIYSFKKLGFCLPFLNSIDSTFLEVFSELYRDDPQEKFLEEVERMLEIFEKNDFFEEKGLLPIWMGSSRFSFLVEIIFKNKFSSSVIMKNNTNFGYGLLDLHRIGNKKAENFFDKLFKGLKNNSVRGGGICNNPFSIAGEADLISSFAVIDMMCDAYYLFGQEKYIKFARSIADFWIERQSEETGLFPKKEGSVYSSFDCETDMSVALFKLGELSGEKKYSDSATRAVVGIIKNHKMDDGHYVDEVNIKNGEVGKDNFKIKFMALFLKPLIYITSGEKIYKNDIIFTLMKDR